MLGISRQTSINRQELLNKIDECSLAEYYLNIHKLPILINSPLRVDNHPSFGLYTKDGKTVYYKDYATGENGSLLNLLEKLWSIDYNTVINRICKDIVKPNNQMKIHITNSNIHNNTQIISNVNLECKIREWKDYDIEYWNNYGITLDWLKYADVYPISHKIIIKNNQRMIFSTDKYAYTFVEFKEGKITHKFYQPFNTNGFKWQNNHDRSVISLWTKIPQEGDIICICSSLKDSLCLWSNLGIPSISPQGEGYPLSQTAINELKRRFKRQIIILDSDEPGRKDAKKLAELTGFTNIELPSFEGGKDISDYFKLFQKQQFINKFKQLLWREQLLSF